MVKMLRSWRDSLILAAIFMSLLAVSQRSINIWVRPGESWIHWIMGVWRCRYLCGMTKVRVFRSLVLPVLLDG